MKFQMQSLRKGKPLTEISCKVLITDSSPFSERVRLDGDKGGVTPQNDRHTRYEEMRRDRQGGVWGKITSDRCCEVFPPQSSEDPGSGAGLG